MQGRRGGRARIALATIAGAGALAAAAHAAAPIGGKLYEGPAPPAGEAVSLLVSKDGRKVRRLFLGFERGCRQQGRRLRQSIAVLVRNRPIRRGRFSWRRSIRYPQTGGWLKTAVKGRFVGDGTRFRGTLRERLANPQNGVRCDSGTVRFGGTVPERALVEGRWAGTTAQGRPLTLTIAPEGVRRLAGEVLLACDDGRTMTLAVGPLSEPASLDSELGFRAAVYGEATFVEVTGRARRGLVAGTIRATAHVHRPDGTEEGSTSTCRADDVAFEARPA